MKNILIALIVLCLCGCTSDKRVATKDLEGSSWEYRSLKQGAFGDLPLYFGDLVIFEPQQISIASPVRLYQPAFVDQEDSSRHFFLVSDSLLVVENREREVLLSRDTLWRCGLEEVDPLLTLGAWVGYELALPTARDSFRCRVMQCGSADQGESGYRIIPLALDSMKRNISQKKQLEFSQKLVQPKLGHRTVVQAFNVPGYPMSSCLWIFDPTNDSTSGDFVFATIDNTTIELHRVRSRKERNEEASHLTKDDVFYLLSQGQISFGKSADYFPETRVRYEFEEDFIKKGMNFDQLDEVGFSFNADGTFDVFRQDHSLKSGTYEISSDCNYLILKKEEYCQYVRLHSAGPDQLALRWGFMIRTPEPLGEMMTSYYGLHTIVNFTALE